MPAKKKTKVVSVQKKVVKTKTKSMSKKSATDAKNTESGDAKSQRGARAINLLRGMKDITPKD